MTVVLHAYLMAWPLCLGILAFAAAVSAAAHFLRIPRLDVTLNAPAVFWGCLAAWLVFFSIIMTLIDSPYLKVSQEVIVWLFMTSAFLGIPMSVPLFAGTVWALCLAARGERVRLGGLLLLFLGTFMLGCVTSNMHDVLWCGVITDWYTKSYPAGGDLLPFYALGRIFLIPTERIADYAVFGPCAFVLILAELIIAFFSLRRLLRLGASDSSRLDSAAEPVTD